ncbi:hypothetical protein BSF41_25640 [Flavobacterium sp. ACN2]|nr:hypothetical protein BSF41_25640 [Flavobacterium sp. ACN2]
MFIIKNKIKHFFMSDKETPRPQPTQKPPERPTTSPDRGLEQKGIPRPPKR